MIEDMIGLSYDLWDSNLMFIMIYDINTLKGAIYNCYIKNRVYFVGEDDFIEKLNGIYKNIRYNIKEKYHALGGFLSMKKEFSYLIRIVISDDGSKMFGTIKDYSLGIEFGFKNSEELIGYMK